MKNILAVLAVVIAGIVGWQFSTKPPLATNADVEAALFEAAGQGKQRELYEILRDNFSPEYQAFLSETTAFANDAGGLNAASSEQGFAIGQQFTSNLRISNAHYIGTAPYDAINRMRIANVAILQDLSDTPDICATYALMGGAALRLDQIDQVNLELIAESANATFLALAAGRDTPVEHAPASHGEVLMILEQWGDQDHVSEDMRQAVIAASVQDPLTCAANLSFEEFLANNPDPLVQKVSITLTLLAAGI
ncbi:hypothetical protein L0664_16145 [Octadecabacter sp. G9-8]|uniref:Uncharacterized protein n=1 Tax=Octadecabacter dasysiphoniae TaxID=2909341 RepID=A0ABS9CZ89_9RHOB|nr:hypothetical protein [Octadecabacter dasysiphoniae]MCF2872605.1 hypothetical protein [Octadecabacter dasysiphoniae]